MLLLHVIVLRIVPVVVLLLLPVVLMLSVPDDSCASCLFFCCSRVFAMLASWLCWCCFSCRSFSNDLTFRTHAPPDAVNTDTGPHSTDAGRTSPSAPMNAATGDCAFRGDVRHLPLAQVGAAGARSADVGRHSCSFSCIVSSLFMIHDHYSYACLLPRAGATGPHRTDAGRTSPSAPMRAATTQDRYRRLSP